MNQQEAIFKSIRKNISGKIVPYLKTLGFPVDSSTKEGAQTLTVKFARNETALTFSVSLHHLDYHDGIDVFLTTKYGEKRLRYEVEKRASKKVPVYWHGLDVVDKEFDRLIEDMNVYFEKYLVEKEVVKGKGLPGMKRPWWKRFFG